MSNYQFVVFSEKGQRRTERKTDELPSPIAEENTSSSKKKQLIDKLTASNVITSEHNSRRQIRIEPLRNSRRRETVDNASQMHQHERSLTIDASASQLGGKLSTGKAKIPRPANAFMLFANEWRKKLAVENPRESNKDISVRLGTLWKSMEKNEKEKYFNLARKVDAEHKRKYPDYVYNPKEARLRKAMREQSRELSRQSILSTPVLSTTENTSTNNNVAGTVGPGSTNFSNHPIPCASPAPTNQTVLSYNTGRIVNPWFRHPTPANHMKPMLPHRVMQGHQRTLDKAKEVSRKQSSIGDCANAFSPPSNPSYPGDFSVHGSTTQPSSGGANDTSTMGGRGNLDSNDYCSIGEFTDGQKWHPYQNGPTPYHPRIGPMTKIPGRHTIGINSHGRQFCGVPLTSIAAQNAVIRGPKHMILLQEQQNRRCGFSDQASMSYLTNNKTEIEFQSGYSQSSYQENEKRNENPNKWDNIINEASMNNNTTREPESSVKELQQQPDEEETKDYTEEIEIQQPKAPSKQPLPGFHQAFGSTEIGRFSRSEFFTNMVGGNGVSRNCTSSSTTTLCDDDEIISNGLIGSSENFNGLALNSHYGSVKNPSRWHSPYVNAIGGDT